MTAEDHVIGVEHVSDLESVCLATGNGDILLYNTHTGHVCTYPHNISLTSHVLYTFSTASSCRFESQHLCRLNV